MSQPNSTKILQTIARFRVLSIASMASVAILTAIMIFSITSVLDGTAATKINLAGRQRLLSQQLVTDALTINTSAHTGDWETLRPMLNEINRIAHDLKEAQSYLDTHNSKTQASEIEAYRATERSFGSMMKSVEELKKLTTSMIRRAPYVDEQTIKKVTATKDEITQAQSEYLPKMKSILSLYEKRFESKIVKSINHAKIGMLLMLIVLVASALFIIEPTILLIRRQIQELDKATQYAMRADAVRWRLLTNMGHEFRTPMNAIMGFADLLNENSLTEPERARLSKSIYESSTQLTNLIATMLDMSAIESGQLSIIKGTCDLKQLLVTLKANTASAAMMKKIDIDLEIEHTCPAQITTDPKKLEQILFNLVDNAIKFTETGKITIHAKLLENNNPPVLSCAITDTGIGINPDCHESIFDPFSQAEDTLTRNFSGAGLGLAVSRDLARAMGGDVTVESTPGKGSTFTLTIDPGAYTNQSDTPEDTSSPTPYSILSTQKILIVDDAKDNRVLLHHIFKRTGAKVEFAFDGQLAIDAVNTARQSRSPYTLILMDMQMPVLDGYHATVELRKQGISIPIIALTAHALDGDREHCLKAGCDEYLSKPVNKELLFETCVRLLNEHAHTEMPVTQRAA